MRSKILFFLLVTALLIALLLPLASLLRAQSIFKDPQGRFTARVPAGWQAQALGEEGTKIAKGAAYCNILPGQPQDPAAAVQQLTEQISGQWTEFQEIKHGESTLAGAPASFGFYSGKNPKGVASFLKLAANARGIVLICSSAQNEFPAVKSAFDQIEQGVSAAGGGTGAASTFSDPQGRFTLRVPTGWQAQPQGEQGAKVSKGDSYVNVVIIPGHGNSNQLVGYLVGQIGPQWKEFKLIKQGTCVLSGCPADYGIFGGVNPRGVAATLRVVGTSLPSEGYALIESAPAAEFNAVRETLEQIEQSFQIRAASPR